MQRRDRHSAAQFAPKTRHELSVLGVCNAWFTQIARVEKSEILANIHPAWTNLAPVVTWLDVASGGRYLKQRWRTKSSSLYVDTRSCTIYLRTCIETWVRRSGNLVSCKTLFTKFELYIYIYILRPFAVFYNYFRADELISFYSEEVCRKKWKSLRDTYLKERRKETKMSGSAAGSVKKWKY